MHPVVPFVRLRVGRIGIVDDERQALRRSPARPTSAAAATDPPPHVCAAGIAPFAVNCDDMRTSDSTASIWLLFVWRVMCTSSSVPRRAAIESSAARSSA